MKNKFLKILLTILLFPCLFVFAACGNNGDGDGKDNSPKDLSSKNPEYVEFRNIMNTVASAFGTDIGLGENANKTDTGATGYSASVGIGVDIDDIQDTYYDYIDVLKEKTPDEIYTNPMYGFENAVANCFKMPVVMADAITQYYGATSVYGKTLELGYDDPTGDIIYYRINKTGNTLSTVVYTPVTKTYTSDTEWVDGGYCYYYTEVEYISATNFRFFMILTSESNTINQLVVGDSSHNLFAFEYYPNPNVSGGVEYLLNYSYGISGKSMSLVSDQTIIDDVKEDYEETKASVNLDFVESIASPVMYRISTANVDKVLNKVAEELGFESESSKYPGWDISDSGVVRGYYGDGSGAKIDKLVIPSEYSAIDANFSIYSSKVTELVIPSSIKKVKMQKQDWYLSEYNQQYNKSDRYSFVDVDSSKLSISVYYAMSSRSVLEKITLEGGSDIFEYDSKHCLYKKGTNTLLYVCDAPVEEYDFSNITIGRHLEHIGDAARKYAKDIKKLSIKVTCNVDDQLPESEQMQYWYRFELLDMFMIGSNNNMHLDELNLYGYNITPAALQEEKNVGITLSTYNELFPNTNYNVVENKFTSSIKELNIYGNYTKFLIQNWFYSNKLTADKIEKVEDEMEYFKITTPFSYYEANENLSNYFVKIGLLSLRFVNTGNGQGYYEIADRELEMELNQRFHNFSELYEQYLYEKYVEREGESARTKLVDSFNFYTNEGTPSTAIITDFSTKEVMVKTMSDYGMDIRQDEYPFAEKVYFDQSCGVSLNVRIIGYGKTLDVYIPVALIRADLSFGSEDKGGDDPDAVVDTTAARIHLPWTKETYDQYYKSRFFLYGNYELVYADTDSTEVYSLWLYSNFWNEQTNKEEKMLTGYFSNNPEMHEITLPSDVRVLDREVTFTGNISKIKIPENYKYILDYHFNLVDDPRDVGRDYLSFVVSNPLTLNYYYSTAVEVAANCPLFTVDADGNLCDKSKEFIIKEYINIGEVFDLTDENNIKNIDRIIEVADLSLVKEVIIDGRVTLVEEAWGLSYKTAKFWQETKVRYLLSNVTTITFKNVGGLFDEYTDVYINDVYERNKGNIAGGEITKEGIIKNLKSFNFYTLNGDKMIPSGQNKEYTVKLEGNVTGAIVDMLQTYSWSDYYREENVSGSGRIKKLYVNNQLVTSDNIESYGFEVGMTRFAVEDNITELVITSNKTNPYLYYTAGTITSVKFAEGVTDADFSIFSRINYNSSDYMSHTNIITNVYFGSTVVTSTSYYPFMDVSEHNLNVHFGITKQEFINSLDEEDIRFENHPLLKWFNWSSLYNYEQYNPNYEKEDNYLEQLQHSNYETFLNFFGYGMRFIFSNDLV